MIGIALALTVRTAFARIVVVEQPEADRVAIQGLLNIDDLGAQDRDVAAVLAQTMLVRNMEFSKGRMLAMTDGRMPTVSMTASGIRFGVTVSPNRVREGMNLLKALASSPPNDAEVWEQERARVESTSANVWDRAMDGQQHTYTTPPRPKVELLINRILRPERLFIAVVGNVKSVEALAAWQAAEMRCTETEPKGYFDISKPTAAAPNSVLTIRGPQVKHDDWATWLASFALGIGKDSPLFRSVREGLGVSYRQEASIVLMRTGIVPRIAIASTQTLDRDQIVSTLVKDIDSWDERTKARAVGMARGSWVYGAPWNPISFGVASSSNSLEDQAFLQAAWFSATGKAWDTAFVLEKFETVSVEDLKSAAKWSLKR